MQNVPKYFFHFTPRSQWQKGMASNAYFPLAFEQEGFIHGSTKAQVLKSAHKWANDLSDLVLLLIEHDKVTAAIKYENLSGKDNLFPHIYGALNPDAVIQAWDFNKNALGQYELPAAIGTSYDNADFE